MLQALLHSGNLRIAASLPDAAVLARELQDFRVRFTEAATPRSTLAKERMTTLF